MPGYHYLSLEGRPESPGSQHKINSPTHEIGQASFLSTIKMSNGFKKFIHLSPVPPIKSIKLFEVQSPNEDKSKSVFEYKVVSPTIKTSDSLGANFD